MSRLNKTQIYAIRWLNHENLTIEKIANELDLNINQVTKTIEKFSTATDKKTVPVKQSPVTTIHTTSGKKNKGVSIMTQEASEAVDKSINASKGHKQSIHSAIYPAKKNV